MTIQDRDLLARLRTAEVEVDDLCRKAKSIHDRASRLDEGQQAEMPPFSGPWTKNAILVHLERINEWVRTPVRAANRRRLEDIGIQGDIHPDVLDDSDSVDDIVCDVQQISSACQFLKPYLMQDECLPVWLSKGIAEAKRRLTLVKNSLESYKRLYSTHLAPKHLEELMKKAVLEPEKLTLAHATATKINSVTRCGIVLPESEDVEKLEAVLTAVSGDLSTLQTQFPEQIDSLLPTLNALLLSEAQTILAAKVVECTKARDALMTEWQRLHRALCLLGASQPDAASPQTTTGLRQQIESFREQCRATVGEEGMCLLAFLQGDAEFPTDLTLDAIRKALVSLRPLIVISPKRGGQDA
jgi:hypothetical protein